jgi:hypothetical protein
MHSSEMTTFVYGAQRPSSGFLLQSRLSIWVEGMGITELFNIYYHNGSILAFIQQWTGQGTLQTLTTASTVLNAFYFLPMEPTTGEHYYQAFHQSLLLFSTTLHAFL